MRSGDGLGSQLRQGAERDTPCIQESSLGSGWRDLVIRDGCGLTTMSNAGVFVDWACTGRLGAMGFAEKESRIASELRQRRQ
ncbi:hypothetical protein M0R45_002324 [Rubus argutus]|uniref:Uncharacterized protein n=1 Tax=Rubus argutus TaxID=59490 RepID=A0AAW1VIK7_RUBAR